MGAKRLKRRATQARNPREPGAARPPRLPGRESLETRRERAQRIDESLAETYPNATCELDFRGAWQLLIATVLSAQCTDKMVNQVTPALFEEFPGPASLAAAPQSRIADLIRKTGFYNQKSKSIRGCAKQIVGEFSGRVPETIEELTRLPGVGRKTASVVIGTAFGQPAVFVDTHVKRLSKRLGLSKSDDPEEVEKDLKDLLPSELWTAFCHRMIHHGRRVCFARKPRCEGCTLAESCPRVGVESSA